LAITFIATIYLAYRQYGYGGLETEVADLDSEKNILLDEKNSLQNQVDALTNDRSNLQSQVESLTSEKESLTSEKNSLQNQVDSLTTENNDLQNELDSLSTPNFIQNLEVTDTRPVFFQRPRVRITGEVWNVGTTAANCRLHVILYQGSDVAEDTYVDVGLIGGRSFESVDETINYDGSPISDYTITAEEA